MEDAFGFGPQVRPQTQNVVATVNLQTELDLKEIVTKARNAEYNPKKFSAVVMRIRDPKSTALIFQTGKVVITGARSENDAQLAARKYARIIQKLGFRAQFTDFRIQNIVGSCDIGFPLRLEGLRSRYQECTSYEPELFPGLIYRLGQPKVVILIFVSGKVVLTGAKTKDEINSAFEHIKPILIEFRKELTELDLDDEELGFDNENDFELDLNDGNNNNNNNNNNNHFSNRHNLNNFDNLMSDNEEDIDIDIGTNLQNTNVMNSNNNNNNINNINNINNNNNVNNYNGSNMNDSIVAPLMPMAPTMDETNIDNSILNDSNNGNESNNNNNNNDSNSNNANSAAVAPAGLFDLEEGDDEIDL